MGTQEPGGLGGIRRILIVQTAYLGDMVLTLPFIDAVRQRFPPAHIAVLTVPVNAALLYGQPGVDAVILFDKRGIHKGLWGMLEMVRRLRTHGYDLVFSPHRSLRSALLIACSGIPRRIGFARWLTRWAYTAAVPRRVVAHEVERNLQLLTALEPGPILAPRHLSLQVAAAARQRARQHFARCDIGQEEVVIGMIPGSQWGTKRWPAERFAALIERLTTLSQLRCVLFGAPQDRVIAAAITAVCRVPVLDLIGQTTLQELPAYLERCAVVVSNDTGPMHIAAARGKPIVALYGPTTAAMGFTPYGVPWEEMSVPLGCRPCNAHGPHRCPLSHWRCMLDLSVEHVAAGVQRLLDQIGPSREAHNSHNHPGQSRGAGT